MKVLELFGGIGACTQALKRLHIPLEIADYVEIDKYAVKSYNAINGTNFEPQDITKWDKDIEVDLIMHGSPCQDFSIAGKQKGADEGSGTRSSLMYETIRIVTKLKPKYVIWENVKNVLSKKHRHNFEAYLEKMQSLGYENYYQVLNAKDYEIPQNRERIFCVSILNGGDFEFPRKKELKKLLKDVLEDEVDEKYYLSDEQVERIKTSTYVQNTRRIQEKDWCDTLCARDWKDPKCVQVGQLYGTEREPNPQAGRIYSAEGLSPTMDTCSGGNRMPKVLVGVDNHPLSKKLEFQNFKNKDVCPTLLATDHKAPKCIAVKTANKKGYDEAVEGDSVNLQFPESKTRRGRVGHGVSQTLQTDDSMGVVTAAAMRGRENGQQIEVSDREYSNALTTVQKDSLVAEHEKPKIIDDLYRNRELRVYEETAPTLRADRTGLKVAKTKCLNSKVNGKQPHVQDKVYDSEGISTAITTAFKPSIAEHTENLRIRKLTPKECWRLMGFSDECFEKAQEVNSNTQLYKQAGNSIVVDVLVHIFRNLLLKQHRLYKKD